MSESNKLQTDFSDDFEEVKKSEAFDKSEQSDRANRDLDGIPYCPDHHCRMKQSSGCRKGSRTAYYSCPVKGCECKEQVIKTKFESVVPSKPLLCPRCKSKNECVRSSDRSTAAYVILECPSCKWRSNALATPQFAAQRESHRRTSPLEEIGGR